MSVPKIICPHCHTEIKPTKSLPVGLVAETRKQVEQQFADTEADLTMREAALRQAHSDLAKAGETINDEVAGIMESERASIIAAEDKKRRRSEIVRGWRKL